VRIQWDEKTIEMQRKDVAPVRTLALPWRRTAMTMRMGTIIGIRRRLTVKNSLSSQKRATSSLTSPNTKSLTAGERTSGADFDFKRAFSAHQQNCGITAMQRAYLMPSRWGLVNSRHSHSAAIRRINFGARVCVPAIKSKPAPIEINPTVSTFDTACAANNSCFGAPRSTSLHPYPQIVRCSCPHAGLMGRNPSGEKCTKQPQDRDDGLRARQPPPPEFHLRFPRVRHVYLWRLSNHKVA
jgi:hypothetical protein